MITKLILFGLCLHTLRATAIDTELLTIGETAPISHRILTDGSKDDQTSASTKMGKGQQGIKCSSSGLYRGEDGQLYKCEITKISDTSDDSQGTAGAGEQEHLYLPGLPSLGLTIFGNKGLLGNYNPAYDVLQDPYVYRKPLIKPLALKKPLGIKPIEIHAPTVHETPLVIKPLIKPIEIKPIIKPIEIQPLIKPIEIKPVIKPLQIKPLIKPIEVKPIVLKPIIKPVALKPIHKPIKKHHKPCHHSPQHHHIKKPVTHMHIPLHKPMKPYHKPEHHVAVQPNHKPGIGGLHKPGHGAVSHGFKDTDDEQLQVQNPTYTLTPSEFYNLFVVPLNQPYADGLEHQQKYSEIEALEQIKQSEAKAESTVDPEISVEGQSGKTIPSIKGVIDNIQHSIQRIPSVLGLQEPAKQNTHIKENSPTPEVETHKSDNSTIKTMVRSESDYEQQLSEKQVIEEIHDEVQQEKQIEITEPVNVNEPSIALEESSPEERTAELEGSSIAPSLNAPEPESDIAQPEIQARDPETLSTQEKKISDGESDIMAEELDEELDEVHVRKTREAPGIPIEILHDQQRSDTILDRTTLLEIMSALKDQYLRNAEPDQRKLIEDAFDSLHCSVRDMTTLDERPVSKNTDGPKKAALELLAEKAQPLADEPDYYGDATDDVSAEPSFLELLNVATKHKSKQLSDME